MIETLANSIWEHPPGAYRERDTPRPNSESATVGFFFKSEIHSLLYTYVEFFQQLDKRIVIPIAVTGIGGTLLAGISAVLHRRDRFAFYLLIGAFGMGVVGSLVTILFNIPINEKLATWNPSAIPTDYEVFLRRWWEWHHVRLVAMFSGMCLTFVAMLVRK